MSNANSYSGGTTITGGTLNVTNTTGSATGSGNVLVSGGTLGGSGIISGNVTVSNGGVLSPGNSPGNLTLGGLTVNGGSYNWQLYDANGAAGVGYDTVTINGDLNLGGISGETPFTINLWSLSAIDPNDVNGNAINFMSATNSYQWTLATTTGDGQVIGFDSASENIFINTTAVLGPNGTNGFSNNLNDGYFSLTADDKNIYLNFTHVAPVPEPATVLALSVAGLGIAGAVRRWRGVPVTSA